MNNTTIQRKVGDKTRNAIINTAKKLFCKNGYSGTSLAQIAAIAKVNKSLILHHFKTKENLWKLVKASFLDTIPQFELTPPTDNLEAFITTLVKQRFTLYDKNPALARIISWQRLEHDHTSLHGMGKIHLQQFIDILKDFQQKNVLLENSALFPTLK